MTTITIDLLALTVFLVLAVALPLYGKWDMTRLRRWVAAGRPDARVATYRGIIALEWVLVAVLLGWWLAEGRGLAAVGLVPAAAGRQWLAVGAGLILAAAMVVQWIVVVRRPQSLAELRARIGDLEVMTPRNRTEARTFDLLSLTAGICEEILYRGILLTLVADLVGTWPAVVITSVIFGLGHAYQGAAGIVKTGGVGLLMAVLTVFSGSIFVPMLLHVALDLCSGRMMAAALAGGDSAASPAPGGPMPVRGI